MQERFYTRHATHSTYSQPSRAPFDTKNTYPERRAYSIQSPLSPLATPLPSTLPSQMYTHPPRPHIKHAPNPRHRQPNPPHPIRINPMHDLARLQTRLPVQGHLAVVAVHQTPPPRALDFAVTCRGRGLGGHGVEGRCGQHFRGLVDEVHGLDEDAVEHLEVEAQDVVVGVGVDGVLLCCSQSLVLWPPSRLVFFC